MSKFLNCNLQLFYQKFNSLIISIKHLENFNSFGQVVFELCLKSYFFILPLAYFYAVLKIKVSMHFQGTIFAQNFNFNLSFYVSVYLIYYILNLGITL